MRAIFFLGICAWAQIETPRLGVMLDRSGAARPVFGVSASVTLGDPVQTGVVSLACSKTRCVTSAARQIVAFDGDSVYVYSGGQLTRDQSDPVPVNVTGEVLSMRVINGAVEYAVRRDDGIWIVRDGDIAVAAIPHATGAVMLLDRAVLFASGRETVLRYDDGSELRFPIRARAFVSMSDEYVQVGSKYALRITRNREKLFLLPEAP